MQYIPKATAKIKEAVHEDDAGNYQEAFQLYMTAINWYEMAYKYAPTPQSKTNIKNTMLQYVARAEDLKDFIEGQRISAAQKRGGKGMNISGAGNNNNNDDNNNSERRL